MDTKRHPSQLESAKSDKVPICERTDMTAGEQSKLLNIDQLYQMASGSLSDSIWAPGNQAKRYSQQTSTRTSAAKIQGQAGLRNLSAASTPLNPHHATDAASPWSSDKIQPHTVTPMTVASTSANMWAANQQELAYTDYNTAGVPPHLRGINYYEEAPQTPQQSKESATSPIWHVSPHSEIKQSLGVEPSAAGIENNPEPSKDAMEHKKMPESQLNSATPISQKVPPTNLEESTKKKSTAGHVLSDESNQVRTQETPQGTLQHPSNIPVQTAPNLPITSHKRFAPASVDNTDAFLAYMQKSMKNSPANGKRYVAVASSTQQKGKEAAAKQEPPTWLAIQTPHKENIPLFTIPRGAALSPTGPGAVKQDGIVDPPSSIVGKVSSQNETPLVVQTGNGQTSLIQDKAVPLDVDAVLTGTQTFAAHLTPQQISEIHIQQAHEIHRAMFSEIMANNPVDPNAPKLTEESLIQNGSWPTRVRSEDSFCEKISDTGVEAKKENVRATQGRDAAEELQNRAQWYPHTPEWEQKNWALDASFIPTYIQQDWLPFITDGKGAPVDMNTDGFRLGKRPVNDRVLGAEIIQPDSIPDIENSESEEKRLRQTVEMDCLVFTKKRAKRYKDAELHVAEEKARYQEIISRVPPPHPYAPAIPIYLRPVSMLDISMVKAIYNYYVKNSFVTEDHVEVQDADIEEIVNGCKNEHLPFIVAVKGKAPVQQQGYGRSSQALLPKFEMIVGFGFAQTYAYGFSGNRDGRSRATVDLQFYVHHEYTRKGVGRSLLDRLIQSLSHSYSGKDGYDWVNPTSDPIYDCTRLWHQLVIQMPVEVKDDSTLPWITKFFGRYWFDQEARLKRFLRTSVHRSNVRFVDLVVFAKSASVEMEYPPFL